ncbi:MAG TPA: HypC/HybG/HupF family hydrogenase formation chaperone [Gemmataceae bacterium]|jgi:hydrogenase expression/formation protein HypC
MCLGIPGKVLETYRENDVLMGKVDFSGIRKRVCLEHVPATQPGDYVLVHVGFALSVLDAEEAGRVFAFLEEMKQLDELKVPSP